MFGLGASGSGHKIFGNPPGEQSPARESPASSCIFRHKSDRRVLVIRKLSGKRCALCGIGVSYFVTSLFFGDGRTSGRGLTTCGRESVATLSSPWNWPIAAVPGG